MGARPSSVVHRTCKVDMSKFKEFVVDASNISCGVVGSFDKNHTLSIINESNNSDVELVPTVFKWSYPAHNVGVTGSFNNWEDVIPLVKNGDEFMLIIGIPVGVHKYKFKVDDMWRLDDQNTILRDPYQDSVNVITVSLTDMDVDASLESDFKQQAKQKNIPEFGKCIPDKEYYKKANKGKDAKVVNFAKSSFETCLNETIDPNVMVPTVPYSEQTTLNHLFLKDLGDNMLTAASTTQRFRKRYVTTVYYKKI